MRSQSITRPVSTRVLPDFPSLQSAVQSSPGVLLGYPARRMYNNTRLMQLAPGLLNDQWFMTVNVATTLDAPLSPHSVVRTSPLSRFQCFPSSMVVISKGCRRPALASVTLAVHTAVAFNLMFEHFRWFVPWGAGVCARCSTNSSMSSGVTCSDDQDCWRTSE